MKNGDLIRVLSEWSILSFVLNGIMFSLFCFVNWNIKPGSWSEECRCVFAIVSFLVIACTLMASVMMHFERKAK